MSFDTSLLVNERAAKNAALINEILKRVAELERKYDELTKPAEPKEEKKKDKINGTKESVSEVKEAPAVEPDNES